MKAEKEIEYYGSYALAQPPKVALPEGARTYLLIKRGLDLLFGALGMIIAAPVILIFALLVILESPGSPFYVQERVGKDGKVFRLIKLRSMRKDAERNGAKWAEADDPRVTRIGRFMRKTRIDELPQFLCILKGDMSLIGPRPERPVFTEQFDREIPGFKKRLLVRPGLTGLAQVCGGYELSPKEKLDYDLEYIRNLSPALELSIVFRTIRVLFTGEGAR